MNADQIKQISLAALDELKGQDIVTLEVSELTDMADYMIICTGSSSRHVKSLGRNVAMEVKKQGLMPLGIEGEDGAEWVLVDFGDVVVHVMLEQTREFYALEKLWSLPSA